MPIEDQIFRQSIANAIEYLQQIQLQFRIVQDDDDEWLIIGMLPTDIGDLRLTLLLQPHQLTTYAYHSVRILKPIRARATEFITRANYGLPMGNFEIDMEDGELRYKVSLPIYGRALPIDLVSYSLNTAIGTLAYYHTGLVQTLYDGTSPAVAIAKLDNPK